MNTQMTNLKMRLKLKKINKEIDFLVEDNFGYSPPNNPHFDELIKDRERLINYLRTQEQCT